MKDIDIFQLFCKLMSLKVIFFQYFRNNYNYNSEKTGTSKEEKTLR